MKKLTVILLMLSLFVGACSDDETTDIKILLSENEITLEEGNTIQLKYEIVPKESRNILVKWASKDKKVADVNSQGYVTAISVGETDIVASTSEGTETICKLTVTEKIISVKSITVNERVILEEGQEFTLDINILPEDATNKNIEWSFSKEGIVETDNINKITALKVGETTITLTTDDQNYTAKCMVEVKEKTEEIKCVDKSGKEYKTVKIGNQVWMAENLAYLNDADFNVNSFVPGYEGEDINEAKEHSNYDLYGVLYNYEGAINAIPEGWKLPTDDDWKQLEEYLGMSKEDIEKTGNRGDVSDKLMSKDLWEDVEFERNDPYGFNARPSGFYSRGVSKMQGTRAIFWGAEDEEGNPWGRAIFNSSKQINRSVAYKTSGYSIRCIKK